MTATSTTLSPAPPIADPGEVVRHRVDLHGQPMSFLAAGDPSSPRVVLLVHGLAGRAGAWTPVLTALSRDAYVLAPDLFGHGESAAPPYADYSAGGHACRLRDLLHLLGHRRVSVVGHSFGGGVAMSFAYQFPERCESLTLISSGGLGPELSAALRTASLPGLAVAANALCSVTPGWLGRLARSGAMALGMASAAEIEAVGRALRAMREPTRRRALLHTLRGAVSWSGQCQDATDRLYLLAGLPTLLIAGEDDRCIPPGHSRRAHELLPNSRLAVLPTGHFPHTARPDLVADLIAGLLAELPRRATFPLTGPATPPPAVGYVPLTA
ncbi:MAG TPA: alpha/beta fold hydrolase [Pseudonocardia sp.]